MKKFASLLLAFAMTVGMLTGCGGDSGTSSTGEAPAQEVTVAISSTFATLDPALISTTHMAHVYGNMGSNFYRTDANGVLQYDLGESMEKSEDGLTYTFTIKEGLKWSDGNRSLLNTLYMVSSVPSAMARITLTPRRTW